MRTKKNSTISMGLYSLFFWVFAIILNISADEACYWEFSSCPEALNDETVTVPENVIAISPKIRSCNLEISDTTKGDPPSIFFMIDNSSSMSRSGGNDTQGKRFTVTKSIIDSIYKVHPDAEIGMAVFQNVLGFDARDYEIFKKLDGISTSDTVRTQAGREIALDFESNGYENQAYLPLIRLNKEYTVKDDDKMTGKEFIDLLLITDPATGREKNYVDLAYKPTFGLEATQNGTNINAAFEAGLSAMKEAKYENKNQFFIFISDGEPSSSFNNSSNEEFAEKEFNKSTPTTFTLYLSANNRIANVPPILTTMTNNIKENNYSDNNSLSNIWNISANDLMEYMEIILDMVLVEQTIKTQTMSITIDGRLLGTPEYDDKDTFFVFGNQTIPLNYKSDSTIINIEAHYDKDKDGKEDSTLTSTFTIIRKKGDIKPNIGNTNCWNRDLELHYKGTSISSVNETMKELEAVFVDKDGNYNSVTIEITNSDKNEQDKIKLPLTRTDDNFKKSFERENADPNINDATLQHQLADSIILTYRNPDNPLDTLRKAFPFTVSKTLIFESAAYYDTDANGYVDSIFIAIDGAVTKDDLKDLTKKIQLPMYRNLNVDTVKVVQGGIAYIVKCKMNKPSTSITSDDEITVGSGILPNGGVVNAATLKIQDKMAPVLINEAILITSNLKTDSLKVTFSEPVEKFNHKNPFLLRKPDGEQYDVTLGTNGSFLDDNQFVEQVSSVQNPFVIFSDDSIWINPSAKIKDKNGNEQTIASNRRVLMNVKYQPYEIEPSVINNPMKPGYKIPSFINKLYEENQLPPPNDGMIIVVKPGQNLPASVKMDAKVTIYDVAKNIIQKDMPMLFEPDSQKLYMVWDQAKAVNRNGRKVATGTYLAVVTIIDNHGMSQVRKIPIGVRR